MDVRGICWAAQGTCRDHINGSVWQAFAETEISCTGLAEDMKLIKFSDPQSKISFLYSKEQTLSNWAPTWTSSMSLAVIRCEPSILPQRHFTLPGGSLPTCCPCWASCIHQLPPDHLQALETVIKLEKRTELNYFEFLKMLWNKTPD